MSKLFDAIPEVDVSALSHGSSADRAACVATLGRAARDVGFVYVTGHGVPETLFTNLLDAAQRFFSLPEQEKMAVYIGRSRNHRGYVPEGEEVFAGGTKDRKEAFDCSIAMLPDPADQIAGDTDVECPVRVAGKDIDARLALLSHGAEDAARWMLKQVQHDEFV